jgi:hypothetical protein
MSAYRCASKDGARGCVGKEGRKPFNNPIQVLMVSGVVSAGAADDPQGSSVANLVHGVDHRFVRGSYSGNTLAFQAKARSSILLLRSKFFTTECGAAW